MLRYGNSTSIVSRTTARFALPNTRNTPLPPHRQVPGQRPPPIAPIVTVTPNGTRIIRPGTPSGGITMTRGGVTPMRRVVVTRPDGSGGHGSMIMQQVQPIRIRQQTDNSQCTECEKTISNEFDRHLHQMHTEPNSWFCRQCGVTEESEIKMFIHYIKEHLSKAYQNHRSSGFKSNVFRLRCPIAACKDAEFLSTKTFDRHMRTNHEDLLPYDCENCDARFATKILQKKHDKKHQEYFVNNGTDASCCSICGTFDMWMLPKDVATDCLQSHLIRHGLDYRSGCRECLRQFPADVHQSVVVRHMRAEHSLVQPDSAITCKICGEMGIAGEDQFMEHCKNAHVFNMLVKSVHSQRGELVITTGLEYENYVGLKTRPVPMSQPLVKPATSRTRVPSTSSSSSDTVPLSSISLADGGNAALLSIAAGISVQSPLGSDDGVEETIE
uniref:C2H2-type domain-containing protein n=1 Tax=Caenorhabditis japonica TaxID=281687 RepID=A0A8R1IAF6_CAEJA